MKPNARHSKHDSGESAQSASPVALEARRTNARRAARHLGLIEKVLSRAQSHRPPPHRLPLKAGDGLALKAHDPVAYFTDGVPTKGLPTFELDWNGMTWRFSRAKTLAAFERKPLAYAPQYGGHCAWAMSQGYLADSDPKAWLILDGKLYLLYSPKILRLWSKRATHHLRRADANWPELLKLHGRTTPRGSDLRTAAATGEKLLQSLVR